MPSQNMLKTNSKKPEAIWEGKPWLQWVLLILPLLLVYGQTLSFEFTNWDDDEYVTRNPLIQTLNLASIWKLFSEFYYLMYIPLTLLTYAVEYHLSGENPLVFHATNVVLHLFNTLLVFVFIQQWVKEKWPALLGGLLFGLHPLRVESVAWVSERKDVLFVFFLLIALISWVRWRQENKNIYYLFALLAFVLSALSKATAVLLVPFMFLLDFWLITGNWKIKWMEKIPFVLIALGTGFVQIKGIQGAVESQADATGYSGLENILILCYSYVFYLLKFIFPWPLSAYYPLPDKIKEGLHWGYYISPLICVGLVWGSWKLYKLRQWNWLYALLWFTIGVFLFLKLRPGGFFIAGDRYTYAASIGVSLALALILQKAEIQWKQKASQILIFVLIGFTLLSWRQTGIWKNSITLFKDVIRQNPEFYMAYVNLGTAYEQKKQYDESINAYRQAIQLKPNYDQPWYNIGNVFLAMDKVQESIEPFRNSVLVNPSFTKAWNNYGSAWFKLGKYDSAIYCYRKALALEPGYPSALSNLGQAFLKAGQGDSASYWLGKALEADPNNGLLKIQLGESAEINGNMALAEQLYAAVIASGNSFPEAYMSLAGLYVKQGKTEEALRWCDKTLEQFPNYNPAWFNKGVLLYQSGKQDQALPLFREAARLGHPQAQALLQQGVVK
jgi:tetratricopeptide (TPR) repeat protein